MQNKLTSKQEAFVRYIIEGKSKTQAYKLAYDTSNFKESTVNVKASQLFKKTDVRKRYDDMINELKNQVIYDRADLIKDLLEIKNIALKEMRESNKARVNGFIALKALEQYQLLTQITDLDKAKLKLEHEKLEFAKSKIVRENEELQKANANKLKELIDNV